MKKPKIKVTITKEDKGYSAIALTKSKFISTQAETFSELLPNILEAINLSFEDLNIVFSKEDIQFSYDLQSFFEYYKVINAKALSERIGMNQSLLAQYISGIKKPSQTQTNKIMMGIQQVGKELSELQLI
jgi:predicted RNase H-like HicB family nuclease